VLSTNYAYVNGHFIPSSQARVGIDDRGFLYGEGIFETMRIYSGRVFRALEHCQRLATGLAALGLESPFTTEELRAICRALIRYNSVADGVARIYITRDSIVVTVRPQVFAPRTIRAHVATIRLDPQLAQLKTANRLPYILAQRTAEATGFDDAVLLNVTGNVVEFTTSNVFVVQAGTLITPRLADGPLPGITRHAILALAEELRIPVREASFDPELLETADEVFATNSLREVMPVSNWSRRSEMTQRLHEAYRQLVRRELV
jgi:branched-subunit amino acid aminotransferase/4-amino-4-deoxychorismate lyase